MPLMNRTIDMAHVNLTPCFSAGVLGTGNKSAERSECKRWMYAGQDGDERYKLIYPSKRETIRDNFGGHRLTLETARCLVVSSAADE